MHLAKFCIISSRQVCYAKQRMLVGSVHVMVTGFSHQKTVMGGRGNEKLFDFCFKMRIIQYNQFLLSLWSKKKKWKFLLYLRWRNSF